MLDYRFPTAMQMVFCIAQSQKAAQRCTSAILATGLEANSSFIRKLMVPLTQHGIIVSTLGRTGSIHLGRPAEDITLRDIYWAVIPWPMRWPSSNAAASTNVLKIWLRNTQTILSALNRISALKIPHLRFLQCSDVKKPG